MHVILKYYLVIVVAYCVTEVQILVFSPSLKFDHIINSIEFNF